MENEEVVFDDVWGIAKSLGVKFKSDKSDMFQMLSRDNRSSRLGAKFNGGCEDKEVSKKV